MIRIKRCQKRSIHRSSWLAKFMGLSLPPRIFLCFYIFINFSIYGVHVGYLLCLNQYLNIVLITVNYFYWYYFYWPLRTNLGEIRIQIHSSVSPETRPSFHKNAFENVIGHLVKVIFIHCIVIVVKTGMIYSSRKWHSQKVFCDALSRLLYTLQNGRCSNDFINPFRQHLFLITNIFIQGKTIYTELFCLWCPVLKYMMYTKIH